MSELQTVRLASDDVELLVVPGAGARIHSLRVRGHELTRPPASLHEHLEDPFFWGGFVMAPWCNRLSPGPLEVAGRTVDLPVNFRDGTAIHGQVYAALWQQTGDGSFAIEQEGHGWPWRYRVEIEYAVEQMRVSVALRLRNTSHDAMPGGIGLHPWFPLPVEVRINSDVTFGNMSAPSVQPVPVAGELDLRNRAPLAQGVDATWPQPGDPPLELWFPDNGLHATVRAPFPTLNIVAAYAPERGAIAAEPETHAPFGLRRLLNGESGAMTMIDPGAEIVLPITFDFDAQG